MKVDLMLNVVTMENHNHNHNHKGVGGDGNVYGLDDDGFTGVYLLPSSFSCIQ